MFHTRIRFWPPSKPIYSSFFKLLGCWLRSDTRLFLSLSPKGAAASSVQVCSQQTCHPSHIVAYAPGDSIACRLQATRIILNMCR
ncbi:hypothetical protein C9426_29320 [Serratia sp. S1B]|nr:hypothetical protein C9426_29320 [Serratia sp. S1B]